MIRAAAALLLLCAAVLLQACGGGLNILDDPRLEQYDDELTTEGQNHVPPTVDVPYATVPPYGGPHDSIPLTCGIYNAAPRYENAVHAMEHGAVVIWFSPRLLSGVEQTELSEIARAMLEDGVYAILAPFPPAPPPSPALPLFLASWGERLPLEEVDSAAIEAYFDAFKHDAPEPTAAGGCDTAA